MYLLYFKISIGILFASSSFLNYPFEWFWSYICVCALCSCTTLLILNRHNTCLHGNWFGVGKIMYVCECIVWASDGGNICFSRSLTHLLLRLVFFFFDFVGGREEDAFVRRPRALPICICLRGFTWAYTSVCVWVCSKQCSFSHSCL